VVVVVVLMRQVVVLVDTLPSRMLIWLQARQR
jgi:hypothetical protein